MGRTKVTMVTTTALLAAMLATCGCGAAAGQWIYLFTSDKGAKVAAEFSLTQGTLMVFVDDVHERLDWPATRDYLFDDLAQELLRTKSATRIIPRETVEQLRRSTPEFDKRGCREIGRMAGAEQVLWVEVQDFLAEEDFSEASEAAYLTVTVKVINPTEEKSRTRVRLWPTSPMGHSITAKLSGASVARFKKKDKIARELSADAAVQIVKLFHEYRERAKR